VISFKLQDGLTYHHRNTVKNTAKNKAKSETQNGGKSKYNNIPKAKMADNNFIPAFYSRERMP
jgi:hypothetical protein